MKNMRILSVLILTQLIVTSRSSNIATSDEQFLTLDQDRSCVQFFVNASDYDQSTDDGRLRVRSSGVQVESHDYVVSLDDRSVHICYPLTDDVERCVNWTMVNEDQFQLESGMELLVKPTGQRRPLGTYYLTANGDTAVICSDGDVVINTAYTQPSRKSRRRCNYIQLSPGEYRIAADEGRDLHLRLSSDDVGINLPFTDYSLDPMTQVVNACYPLTQDFLNCSAWWILERHEIVVQADRRLLSKPHGETYGPGDYFLIDGGRAVTCVGDNAVDGSMVASRRIAIALVQILSVVCLAAAIVVHLFLPDLSYQRAPLLCHAGSLLVTYVCLTVRGLATSVLLEDEGCCYLLFYVTYYAALAAFCWLSVLAFDLWHISRSVRDGSKPYPWVTRCDDHKFLAYCVLGWGVPTALTALVSLVDMHEQLQDALHFHPGITAACWFNERPSAFAFFYGPVCSLLAANFVLFGLSVYNIWFADRHAEFTNRKLNKQLLVICFVVHLTMGLCWIMEVVSYSMPADDGIPWFVPDLVNALQGVVVAAVYTCRQPTWKLLKNKITAESKD